MRGKVKQQVLALCEQADKERDPERFRALMKEINRLIKLKRYETLSEASDVP